MEQCICVVTITLRLFLKLSSPDYTQTKNDFFFHWALKIYTAPLFFLVFLFGVSVAFPFYIIEKGFQFILKTRKTFGLRCLSMMKQAVEYIAVMCSWAPALQEEPTWRRHWSRSLIHQSPVVTDVQGSCTRPGCLFAVEIVSQVRLRTWAEPFWCERPLMGSAGHTWRSNAAVWGMHAGQYNCACKILVLLLFLLIQRKLFRLYLFAGYCLAGFLCFPFLPFFSLFPYDRYFHLGVSQKHSQCPI